MTDLSTGNATPFSEAAIVVTAWSSISPQHSGKTFFSLARSRYLLNSRIKGVSLLRVSPGTKFSPRAPAARGPINSPRTVLLASSPQRRLKDNIKRKCTRLSSTSVHQYEVAPHVFGLVNWL